MGNCEATLKQQKPSKSLKKDKMAQKEGFEGFSYNSSIVGDCCPKYRTVAVYDIEPKFIRGKRSFGAQKAQRAQKPEKNEDISNVGDKRFQSAGLAVPSTGESAESFEDNLSAGRLDKIGVHISKTSPPGPFLDDLQKDHLAFEANNNFGGDLGSVYPCGSLESKPSRMNSTLCIDIENMGDNRRVLKSKTTEKPTISKQKAKELSKSKNLDTKMYEKYPSNGSNLLFSNIDNSSVAIEAEEQNSQGMTLKKVQALISHHNTPRWGRNLSGI